jgi:serine protease AprX
MCRNYWKKADINRLLLFVFLVQICLVHNSYGQENPYIIYFKDKANSPYSISSPENYLSPKAIARRTNAGIAITHADLPVNKLYLDSLVEKGATLLYPLKWPNAAVILAEPAELAAINNLPFVASNYSVARKTSNTLHNVEKNNQDTELIRKTISANLYGNSYNQIQMLEADQMHSEGFHGEGITIAVFDAGFKNASSVPYLNHVFTNNRVLATYDFVDFETNVYDNHEHGLQAMSAIASYQENNLIGTAYNASFVLLRTENEFSETQLEEANWARGAEFADSIGADIISASLGYSTFDNVATNHTYQDLNTRSR